MTALTLTAALTGAFGAGSIAAAGERLSDNAERPSLPSQTGADDGNLWDRIRLIGLPRHYWVPVATAMGLSPRDGWISADGLTWDHLDGRRIVVATPRTPNAGYTGDQTCS